MDDQVRIIDCFYVTMRDRPGDGYRLLEHLSEREVSLRAFTAFPVGAEETQICLVTDAVDDLKAAAKDAGVLLTGPKQAFLIEGSDRIGALHAYHQTMANAGVNMFASSGVCAGNGRFGFVMWVEPEDFDKAFDALGIGG